MKKRIVEQTLLDNKQLIIHNKDSIDTLERIKVELDDICLDKRVALPNFISKFIESSKTYLKPDMHKQELNFYDSKDQIVIKQINGDKSMADTIKSFSNLKDNEILGSSEVKRIVVGIVDRIKKDDFIMNKEIGGIEIYNGYIDLKEKININYIQQNNGFNFKNELVQNLSSYMIMSVGGECTDLQSFCRQINMVFSGSISSIPLQIQNTSISEIFDRHDENIDEITNKNKKVLDDIQISNQSIARLVFKGFLLYFKGASIITLMSGASIITLGGVMFIRSNKTPTLNIMPFSFTKEDAIENKTFSSIFKEILIGFKEKYFYK